MISKKRERLNLYLSNADIALTSLKEKGHTYLNNEGLYQALVYQTSHNDVPTDLIHEMLSADQMVELFDDYIKQSGVIVCEIKFNIEETLYQPENSLEKATVKTGGDIWRIHKNDADPFPSSPHAHLVGTPLKLHLGSGMLFKRKEFYRQLPRKEFLELLEIIKERTAITLPNLEV